MVLREVRTFVPKQRGINRGCRKLCRPAGKLDNLAPHVAFSGVISVRRMRRANDVARIEKFLVSWLGILKGRGHLGNLGMDELNIKMDVRYVGPQWVGCMIWVK
jgi:hypothetical protein